MTALSLSCPHCGSTNEFVMVEVHKATAINCSHCGEAIGPWGKLIQNVAKTAPAPTFESNWPLDDARSQRKRSRKITAR